jgi:hypothetical protein
LVPVVDRLRKRFSIGRVCIVAYRGNDQCGDESRNWKRAGCSTFSVKAEEDAKFDGVFVLRTNTDLAPLDAVL